MTRRIVRSTCHGYSQMLPFLKDKYGLEIGGPSRIFPAGRLIPIYDRCRKIDTCNFARNTLWDGAARSNGLGSRVGWQLVAEASSLDDVPEGRYDFVAASHVLEHIANPLRALSEWKRVLAPGGVLIVIVPDKRATFDRRREYTTFDHLVADYVAKTPESDLTHLDEILAKHDLKLDPLAGSPEHFRERCFRNFELRAMHHHVFSPDVMVQLCSHIGMRVLDLTVERPFHIVLFAQKPPNEAREETAVHNCRFLGNNGDWGFHKSIYRIDESPL